MEWISANECHDALSVPRGDQIRRDDLKNDRMMNAGEDGEATARDKGVLL